MICIAYDTISSYCKNNVLLVENQFSWISEVNQNDEFYESNVKYIFHFELRNNANDTMIFFILISSFYLKFDINECKNPLYVLGMHEYKLFHNILYLYTYQDPRLTHPYSFCIGHKMTSHKHTGAHLYIFLHLLHKAMLQHSNRAG